MRTSDEGCPDVKLSSSFLSAFLCLSVISFPSFWLLVCLLYNIFRFSMSKEYRDDSIEEAEPLTGEDGGIRRVWKSEKISLRERIEILRNSKHRWIWFAHAALLSISLGSLALSLYIRSSTQSIPYSWSMFNRFLVGLWTIY